MPRTTTEIDPEDLKERIVRVYKEMTREEDERGALTWFARRANLNPSSVQRWVRGETSPVGPAVALLEEFERQVGVGPGAH